jgi:hypothetical protein
VRNAAEAEAALAATAVGIAVVRAETAVGIVRSAEMASAISRCRTMGYQFSSALVEENFLIQSGYSELQSYHDC